MTVGMAALSEVNGGEPKVIISSDRMVTTRQQSRIEHEHPETKLREFGTDLTQTNLMGVIAGSIQLAESFEQRLNFKLNAYTQQQGEEPWINTSAELASQVYREIVQEKIENRVLSAYGLELDDLSRQHQFKDDFLSDILSEVSQV